MRCRCGHERSAHKHYRGGNDCALCDCDARRYHLTIRNVRLAMALLATLTSTAFTLTLTLTLALSSLSSILHLILSLLSVAVLLRMAHQVAWMKTPQ